MSPGAVKQGSSVQRSCGSCLGEETKGLGELPWKKGIEDPREADAISFQRKKLAAFHHCRLGAGWQRGGGWEASHTEKKEATAAGIS